MTSRLKLCCAALQYCVRCLVFMVPFALHDLHFISMHAAPPCCVSLCILSVVLGVDWAVLAFAAGKSTDLHMCHALLWLHLLVESCFCTWRRCLQPPMTSYMRHAFTLIKPCNNWNTDLGSFLSLGCSACVACSQHTLQTILWAVHMTHCRHVSRLLQSYTKPAVLAE